jgi:quercetin dioxygenase-like cupin family protein
MGEASLLGPDDGEVVVDTPARRLVIKVSRADLVIVEFRIGPRQDGPPRHVHHHHTDCFYVLEGELTLDVAGEQVIAGPGTWVMAPPGVVHTFRNAGDDAARWLNVHVPGCGFDEYVRSRGAAPFDQHDPPTDGGRPFADAVVRGPGEGQELAIGASTLHIKASVHDADGALALTEQQIAPGFPGPGLHRHREMLDSFWVLGGELMLQIGEQTATATPGSYAVIAPGNAHTFSNPTSEPVHALNLMVPAGLEQYLVEVHNALRPGEPPDPALFAQIASRYDFEPLD